MGGEVILFASLPDLLVTTPPASKIWRKETIMVTRGDLYHMGVAILQASERIHSPYAHSILCDPRPQGWDTW